MLSNNRNKSIRNPLNAEYDLANPFSSAGIKPGTFDLILSAGTLHFSGDLSRTLADSASALAKGGVLAVTYIPPQERKFGPHTTLNDPAVVAKAVRALGLEIVKHESFIAYREKGDPNDPVRYQLLLARKVNQKERGFQTLEVAAPFFH
jgi:predicted TPR repeat methyltransferase